MRIDTEQIIMALERFVSRRGLPVVVYSDNGTQLKKASKEVAALWKAATDGVLRHAAREGITWKFIVENAPWWGGFYERMVGTMKGQLCKVIGNALLTVKEFETVLCKVEATINSRPITYQFNTIGEPRPLTPNDLLVGQRAVSFPSFLSNSFPINSTRSEYTERVKYRELLHQEWETRWKREYLADRAKQFNARHKVEKIAIGEVVMVEAENLKKSEWTTGVIQQLFPSVDGIVRSVELRTPLGILRRPIQRLHALELNEEKPLSAGDDHNDDNGNDNLSGSSTETIAGASGTTPIHGGRSDRSGSSAGDEPASPQQQRPLTPPA
jgi:hypothetical protein